MKYFYIELNLENTFREKKIVKNKCEKNFK